MVDSAPGVKQGDSRPGGLLWVIIAGYLAASVAFSIVQPLARPPDEPAHMVYVKFLAQEHRLPVWNPQDGGEAWYEGQHPPLYYTAMAVAYRLCSPLPEEWRWYVLRWLNTLLGGLVLLVAWRFFRDFAPAGSWWPEAATATCAFLPAALAYTSYINPDLPALFWATICLWLAGRLWLSPDDRKLAIWAGIACGCGVLTKMSVVWTLPLVLGTIWRRGVTSKQNKRVMAGKMAYVVVAFGLVAGWYFARNVYLYGQPAIHTAVGHMGSGLDLAFVAGFGRALWLTVRNTFLSTWIPVMWPPAGWGYQVSYAVILLGVALALVGLGRGHHLAATRGPHDPKLQAGANLCAAAVLLAVLAHQWSFWMWDVELNMGGRYLLAIVPALAWLLTVGMGQWGPRLARVALPVWVGGLLLINVASAWNIATRLNPRYSPGWELFHFPQGEPSGPKSAPPGPAPTAAGRPAENTETQDHVRPWPA